MFECDNQTVNETISKYICGEINVPPIGDPKEMKTEKVEW